ncbi:MAG: glutaredoxin family protein [Halapricum sp.]
MASEITRIIIVVTVMGVAVVGVTAVAQNQPWGSDGADTSVPTADEQTTGPDVCVVFFYSPNCPHCGDVEDYLERASQQRNITVTRHNTQEQSSIELLSQYHEQYDVSEEDRTAVPIVFVGDEYAVGDEPAISLIEDALATGETVPCPEINASVQPSPTPAASAAHGHAAFCSLRR